ncbi:hypothetical protein GF351_03450 [Candidatus Woesearchaeota archaeon]|nr:hypothetical protein [Candidatus Woesearchaeota archaeon]
MDYDLELDKAAVEIRRSKAKKVLIQLPDGLKPQAGKIQQELEAGTGAEIFIWMRSCYGACDTPNLPERAESWFDLLIQWGHSRWV